MGPRRKEAREFSDPIPCDLSDPRFRRLAREWFEANKKWCPLFGETESGPWPECHATHICLEIIREARTFWEISDWADRTEIETDGLDKWGRSGGQRRTSWPEPEEVPRYPKYALLEARKIFFYLPEIDDEARRYPLPWQTPSAMWYHEETETPIYNRGAMRLYAKGARSRVGNWGVDPANL